MSDETFEKIRKHYREVYAVSVNDLSVPFLTNIFKRYAPYLKYFPFRIILPISVVGALAAYLIFGMMIIRLVSRLQYGF